MGFRPGRSAAGCTPRSEPEAKPRGQTVGWVRNPRSTLIEIASPL